MPQEYYPLSSESLFMFAMYALYIEDNYERMCECRGWTPLCPQEFFESEEYENYRDRRMWQTAVLQHTYTTDDGYTCSKQLSTITVGPAETLEQAECLLRRHGEIAYLSGQVSFTLTRVSDLLPAPLSRSPGSGDDERLTEILYEADAC